MAVNTEEMPKVRQESSGQKPTNPFMEAMHRVADLRLRQGRLQRPVAAPTQGESEEVEPKSPGAKKYSRRAILGGAAVLGAGLAVAAVVSNIDKVENFVGLSGKKEQDPQISFFEGLRGKILESDLPDSEKFEAARNIDMVVKSTVFLKEIRREYAADLDVDGNPRYFNLIAKRYGKLLDLAFDKPEERQAYIEDQIGFLKDLSEVGKFKDELAAAGIGPREISALFRQFIERRQGEGAIFVLPESSRSGELSFNRDGMPDNFLLHPEYPEIYLTPLQMEQEIRTANSQMPQLAKAEFAFKKSGSTQFRSDIGGPIDHFEISVNSTRFTFPKAARHDLAHARDPYINAQRIAPLMLAEDYYRALVLREGAISDNVWGRTTPDVDKMFSDKRSFLTEVLNKQRFVPEDIFELATRYADNILIEQTNYGTGIVEPLFDKYLDTADFKRARTEINSRFGARSSENYTLNFAQTLETIKPYTDSLRGNPLWNEVMPRIERRRQAFNNTSWLEKPPTGRIPIQFEGLIGVFGRAILTAAFIEGDRAVTDLFKPNEVKDISAKLMRILTRATDEQFADGVAYSLLLKDKTDDIDQSSYLRVLDYEGSSKAA